MPRIYAEQGIAPNWAIEMSDTISSTNVGSSSAGVYDLYEPVQKCATRLRNEKNLTNRGLCMGAQLLNFDQALFWNDGAHTSALCEKLGVAMYIQCMNKGFFLFA